MEVSLAEKLPVPSISEVLGYLAPGATLLAIVYASEAYVLHAGLPFHTPAHTTVALLGLEAVPDTWAVQVLLVLALALSCYILGHLVDSIAKVLIDRTFIYKGYGYPYQSLLDLPNVEQREERQRLVQRWERALKAENPSLRGTALSTEVEQCVQKTPRRTDISGAFYRGFFFWFNLYLIVRWSGLVLASRESLGVDNYVWRLANRLGIWCLVLILFKLLGGRWIRSLVRRIHDSIGTDDPRPRLRAILTFYRAVSIGFYDLLAIPLGKMLNTRRSLDTVFVAIYKQRFRHCFGLDAETAESNNYWFPFMYILERSAKCASLLARYHQLYRFSRNLSTALFMSFTYCITWYYLNARAQTDLDTWPPSLLLKLLPLVLIAALLFLLHFYYLYVCYYSKFLFRSFVFLSQPPTPDDPAVHDLAREAAV